MAITRRLSSSSDDKPTEVSENAWFYSYGHHRRLSVSGTTMHRYIDQVSVPASSATDLDMAYTIDGGQVTFAPSLPAADATTAIRKEAVWVRYAKGVSTASAPTTDCTNLPHPISEKYSINEVRIDK